MDESKCLMFAGHDGRTADAQRRASSATMKAHIRHMGNGYSVLLAVCSAICSASFWSHSANLYGAEHFGE